MYEQFTVDCEGGGTLTLQITDKENRSVQAVSCKSITNIPVRVEYNNIKYLITKICRGFDQNLDQQTNLAFEEKTETGIFSHLIEIEENSFCKDYENISLPNSLTNINPNAFLGRVKEMKMISSNNSYERGSSDCRYLYHKDKKALIWFNKESLEFYNFGDLGSIYSRACSNCRITSIKFPASLRIIHKMAFEHSGLTKIEYPESSQLELIGESAFKACPLDNIELPSSLVTIEADAFAEITWKQIKNKIKINIPRNTNLHNISIYAFRACSFEISVDGPQEWKNFIESNAKLTKQLNGKFNE